VFQWLAFTLSPVYWAYRAIHRGAHDLPAFLPAHVDYEENTSWACAALGLQVAALVLATVWCLRRKDVGR
jgi:hypothetical protein